MTQATIYYLDGHQRIGTVSVWDPSSGRVELTAGSDKVPITPEWPLIAHVDRPLHVTPLGKRDEFQNYVIQLVNQQTLGGKMISASVATTGIQICHYSDRENLIERFVPWQAVKTYRLGHIPLQSDWTPKAHATEDPGLAEKPPETGDTDPASPLALGLLEVKNASQLKSALDRSKAIEQSGYDRNLNRTLGDILVQSGILDSEQLNVALHRKRSEPARPVGQILIEMGLVSEEVVQRALAYKLGVPFVNLEEFNIDPEAVKFIPPTTAARLGILPLMFYDGRLVIALSNPSDSEALNILNFLVGYPAKYALAPETDLSREIDHYYGAAESQEAAEELEMELVESPSPQPDRQAIEKLGQEKPVIRFVNSVIRDAIRQNASDIHLSPREDYVQLIYRLNGDMIPVKRFNKGMLAAAVSRIKIIGGMDITERRVPQDGRASVRWDRNDAPDRQCPEQGQRRRHLRC